MVPETEFPRFLKLAPPDTPFTALELGDVLDRSRSFWSAPVLGEGFLTCFSFLLPQLMTTVMYMD